MTVSPLMPKSLQIALTRASTSALQELCLTRHVNAGGQTPCQFCCQEACLSSAFMVGVASAVSPLPIAACIPIIMPIMALKHQGGATRESQDHATV